MGLTLEDLRARFPAATDGARYMPVMDGAPSCTLPAADLLEAVRWLRDEAPSRYRRLTCLTATDESLPAESEPDRTALRPGAEARFRVVYNLATVRDDGPSELLRLVVWTGEGEPVPSVTDLHPGADWMEREVFDMFGVLFDGHPDLKRILMPDGFEAHPLRKEYPLRGVRPDHLYREWDVSRGGESGAS
ncbi:MAG: NADH-quinone oxidoreductase subunit C [Planctomycetota bacterium]